MSILIRHNPCHILLNQNLSRVINLLHAIARQSTAYNNEISSGIWVDSKKCAIFLYLTSYWIGKEFVVTLNFLAKTVMKTLKQISVLLFIVFERRLESIAVRGRQCRTGFNQCLEIKLSVFMLDANRILTRS